MGRYAWIIFIAVMLWQVIAGIAQNAAKKQQQAKMSEEARRRREAAAGGEASRASTSSGPVVAGPRNARLDDLAARRKAQLEELRKRRAAGATGAANRPPRGTQTRVGPTPTTVQPGGPGFAGTPGVKPPRPARPPARGPARTPAPARARGEIEQVSADLRAIQGTQDRDKLVREEQSRLKHQEAAVAQRRKEQQREEERRRAQARRQAAVTQDAADAYAADTGRAKRERIVRYGRLLRSRRTLQDLFILREVLDPPVALRPVPIGEAQ